jgi:DNA-binding transcriptional ArsR family regulator
MIDDETRAKILRMIARGESCTSIKISTGYSSTLVWERVEMIGGKDLVAKLRANGKHQAALSKRLFVLPTVKPR